MTQEEYDFIAKQKTIIENGLVQLASMKVTPFSVCSVVRKMQKTLLAIGSIEVGALSRMYELANQNLRSCKIIQSLQEQIDVLEKKIEKMEM